VNRTELGASHFAGKRIDELSQQRSFSVRRQRENYSLCSAGVKTDREKFSLKLAKQLDLPLYRRNGRSPIIAKASSS
jgi:hypothetical protein